MNKSSFPEDQIIQLEAYRPAPLRRYRFVDIRTYTTRQEPPESTIPATPTIFNPFWVEAVLVIGVVVLVSEPWSSEMAFFKVVFPIIFGLIGLMLADANITKRRDAFKAHCARSRERMHLTLQEQAR